MASAHLPRPLGFTVLVADRGVGHWAPV